jgi:uncharacterized protein (TIGR02246 family)
MADMTPELKRLVDENEIRSLAMRYAQAADRRDTEAFASLFTEDAAIVGPGIEIRTKAVIGTVPKSLEANYERTYHIVHNHLITVGADEAQGEVYSQAHHLNTQEDGRVSDYIMAITYRDRYVRQGGAWLFSFRDLEVRWTQTQWVDMVASI